MSGKQLLKRLLKGKKNCISVDVLTGYARWANNYPPTAHNPLMEIEQQAMLSLLPDDLSGNVCLDLACGSGRYMRLVEQRRANRIYGIDYSPEMLARASEPVAVSRQPSAVSRQNDKSRNTQHATRNTQHAIRNTQSPNLQLPITNHRLTRAPFFPLPFPNATFHLIVSGLAMGHEKNLDRLLAEAARVLRPGGSIIYSDFHPVGALLGWQRTFTTDDGTLFNVEHHLHLYSHHHRACQKTGLTIEAVLEPEAGECASPEFQHVPAVLVIKAVKG